MKHLSPITNEQRLKYDRIGNILDGIVVCGCLLALYLTMMYPTIIKLKDYFNF